MKATSVMAQQEIAPVKKSQRQRVLDFLRSRGAQGATDEEIEIGLSMNPSTVRPRRIELERRGMAAVTTEMRPTRSGRFAFVTVALP